MAALHYATYFDVGRVVSELLEVSEAMGELDCEGVGWWVYWLVCESMIWLVYMRVGWWVSCSTGIIRFFTKQIATEGFSTVFGQSRCAL